MKNKHGTRWVARLGLVLGLLGALAPAHADEALWQKIRSEPNMVLILRHGAIAPQPGQTGATFDAGGNCRGEIMLSARGREESALMGRLLKERGVDPHVVSSAMCRNRDTAMLAFGRVELDPALRESGTGDQARFREFLSAATGWILKYRGKRPLVMIMHLPNIDSLTGEQTEHGEMLVTQSSDKGELDVLGRITLYKPAGH